VIEKKVGRPKGSNKNGERTAQKALDILKTKAWAQTCSYFISLSGKPATSYMCARQATQWCYRHAKGGTPTPDTAAWGRWLKGERGVTQATTESLWEETSKVFTFGPWVGPWSKSAEEAHSLCNLAENIATGKGGFIPLWDQIRGDISHKDSWEKIPLATWENWAQKELLGVSSPKFNIRISDSNFLPTLHDFKSDSSLHKFLAKIVCLPTSPPLLSFTAALCLARLDSIKKLLFFDPKFLYIDTEFSYPYSLRLSQRPGLLNALQELNITFPEIAHVCHKFGLEIYDCGILTRDEYLKFLSIDNPGYRGLRSEDEWRAIFGPQNL